MIYVNWKGALSEERHLIWHFLRSLCWWSCLLLYKGLFLSLVIPPPPSTFANNFAPSWNRTDWLVGVSICKTILLRRVYKNTLMLLKYDVTSCRRNTIFKIKKIFMIDNHSMLDLARWLKISFKHIIYFLKLKAEIDTCIILFCNDNRSK